MSEQQSAWGYFRACGGFCKKYSPRFGRSALLVAVACVGLAACGGGGGGGGARATTQNISSNSGPSLSFSSSSSNVAPGQSVTLTWQTQNADSCRASGGWSGDRAVSGSETVGPLQQSQTFSLSCSGTGGGALREVSVNVTQDTGVSVSLNSSSPAVLANGQVTLNWNAQNANSCEASGGWSGQQALSGSFTSGPISTATTFKITCFAQGDSAVALVTVEVTDKTLRWQAPTENVDGSALTDLAGFNVYWGNNSRSYTSSTNLGANAREWEIPLGSGTYYLAVTALDSEANESSYSNEVRKIIP